MAEIKEILRAIYHKKVTSVEDGDDIVVGTERIRKDTLVAPSFNLATDLGLADFGNLWSLIVTHNGSWGVYNKTATGGKVTMTQWRSIKDLISTAPEGEFWTGQKRPFERDYDGADDEFKVTEKRQKTEADSSSSSSEPGREFGDKIETRERKTTTRLSILLCEKSFVDLLEHKIRPQPGAPTLRSGAPDPRNSPHPSIPSPSSHPKRSPVIVVPSLITYTINVFNVKSFLESGRIKVDPGTAKPTKVSIARNINGKPVTFKIVESPSAIDPKTDVIVGIFLTGTSWQLKGFPLLNDKSDDHHRILREVVGFFPTLDGREVPLEVRGWNSIHLPLSSAKEFQNVVGRNIFWDKIEAFCRSKPYL